MAKPTEDKKTPAEKFAEWFDTELSAKRTNTLQDWFEAPPEEDR